MIEMRRAQLSFGDGLIAEEVSDLREDWMEHADAVLADEDIVAAVYEALARRHAKSRSRGRRGAPAEMVLRLLILKHVRNWSYEVLEREVRANLVYRDFTRVGAGKTPDAKTIGRWGLAVGPEVVKQVHQRLVKLAQANGLAAGRKMRVDTTDGNDSPVSVSCFGFAVGTPILPRVQAMTDPCPPRRACTRHIYKRLAAGIDRLLEACRRKSFDSGIRRTFSVVAPDPC
jgi:hypothetical protein